MEELNLGYPVNLLLLKELGVGKSYVHFCQLMWNGHSQQTTICISSERATFSG